jgi:CRISPR-associated protein Csb1
VDFSNTQLDGIMKITSLDAPHRVYDAILRDSLLDGKRFMESPIGERLAKAKAEDASALLEVSPTALLFGAWRTRYDKLARNYFSALCLIAAVVFWL